MSVKNLFLFLAFILLLAASACAPITPNTVTVSEADAGKTIALKVGDFLLVRLEGNPTTGFNWWPGSPDAGLLKMVGEQEFTPDKLLVGSPGKINLKFEAVTTGKASLKLNYQRAWEKDIPPLKTFEVTLEVK